MDVFRSWQRAEKQAAEPMEHRYKASAGMKSLLTEMLPDDRLKKEWNKWLRHSDPRIAFEAFKLANAYLFGKSVQAVAGEEMAPPIKIDISAIPKFRVPA